MISGQVFRYSHIHRRVCNFEKQLGNLTCLPVQKMYADWPNWAGLYDQNRASGFIGGNLK